MCIKLLAIGLARGVEDATTAKLPSEHCIKTTSRILGTMFQVGKMYVPLQWRLYVMRAAEVRNVSSFLSLKALPTQGLGVILQQLCGLYHVPWFHDCQSTGVCQMRAASLRTLSHGHIRNWRARKCRRAKRMGIETTLETDKTGQTVRSLHKTRPLYLMAHQVTRDCTRSQLSLSKETPG
jgi:hypothetical protein